MHTRLLRSAVVTAVAAVLQAVGPGLAAAQSPERHVVRVPVTGTVELGLAPFLGRVIAEAEDSGAQAVILDIDTPGGRIDAAWQIIDDVRDSEVPVYAFVNRRALSAGAMIALSAERLFMLPGSTIGAATPVVGDGQKASEKMVSAMRSEFRALAEERGFDPMIGEAMVDESIVIEGVIEEGRLLTLTTSEAVELDVAEGEVESYEALIATLGLQDAQTTEPRPNWAEALVRFLTNPALAPMLLSLGFLGLMIEIRTPTFGLAGGVGLLCLFAFFGAHWIVHLAGLEELLLLGFGTLLIAAEILVIPGFGIAGILGGLAVLSAATFSMVGVFPTSGEIMEAAGIVGISILVLAALGYAIFRHLPHSRSMSGVFLEGSTSADTGYISAPDRADLVGQEGIAVTDLRPAGTAAIGEERVDVVTEGPWIAEGARVKVLQSEGVKHVVREIKE
ncbi:MAG: NfeD family protein [Gemmatimonadota bacterium]